MIFHRSSLTKVKVIWAEAASLIGKSHKSKDLPNQDACFVKNTSNGIVIAVADGVGSDKDSEYASQAAVHAVYDIFMQYHPEQVDILGCLICKRFDELMSDAPSRVAGTTCIFCVLLNGTDMFLGQAGDGVCCGFIDNEPFILKNKNSDFANIVCPMFVGCSREAWSIMHFQGVSSTELMLATDGIADDILPGMEAAFARHLVSELERLPQQDRGAAVMEMLEHWETPNSFDDKTIALCRLG